jgi:hypothetical protein
LKVITYFASTQANMGKIMNYLDTLESIAKGAGTGVAVVIALPVFGAVGTITATGVAVGSAIGAAAALVDKMKDEEFS